MLALPQADSTLLVPELPHRHLFQPLIDNLGIKIRPLTPLERCFQSAALEIFTGTIALDYAEPCPRRFGISLAHEVGHWTGLKHNLNRRTPNLLRSQRGEQNELAEEWVAESIGHVLHLYTGIPFNGNDHFEYLDKMVDGMAPSTKRLLETRYRRQVDEGCLFLASKLEGKDLYGKL